MDGDYGSQYAALYNEHWWWRAREAILLEEIRSYRLAATSRILDFGCGDGLMLPQLARFGEVWGIEADAALVSSAHPLRERISVSLLEHSPLRREKFDLITALDVLEHIEHDAEILQQLYGMLRPGGRIVITVPAFMALWDRHDEINRHFRRYTTASLRRIFPAAAAVHGCRYMFHALFTAKLAIGTLNRWRRRPIPQHRLPPRWVNTLMTRGLLLEHRCLRWMRLPFGTSVFAVLGNEARS